jgi:hypothetical protein
VHDFLFAQEKDSSSHGHSFYADFIISTGLPAVLSVRFRCGGEKGEKGVRATAVPLKESDTGSIGNLNAIFPKPPSIERLFLSDFQPDFCAI